MISIIIPTLNEEAYLRHTILHTLAAASNKDELEIIVVDAGSSDQTLESIEDLNVRTFKDADFIMKKYKSLNFGFSQSSGEVILFLDADTFLPDRFDSLIEQCLKHGKVVGGAFEFAFDRPDWKLQLITVFNRIRYRIGKIFYGDQAVFVRRSALTKIDGVPAEPLMETAYLCKSLQKFGQLKVIKPSLKTSPRRFDTHGFFKVAWFDINMLIRFNLGLPVSEYAVAYWSENHRMSK